MLDERIVEKCRSHNAIARRLEAAGFVLCEGRIFTGDAFNRETCTWNPYHSGPIGRLTWKGDRWVIEPEPGYGPMFERGDFDVG